METKRFIGQVGIWAAFVVLVSLPLSIIYHLSKKKQATPSAEVDAVALCLPYGGLKEQGSRTFTIKQRVEETGISAHCNDGSWVSRYTEKPKERK
jgi:hypothetical protein